jgi:hypothetical protein
MNRFLLPLLVFAVFVSSCRRDIESATWNSRAVAPLIKSSMSINDLVGGDAVQKNNDNSIKVVYKEKLYSVTSDSLLEFPDSTYTYGTSLQSLVLANDSVVYPVTLGKIARDQGPLGGFILGNQGNPIDFDAFTNISTNDINLDGSNFFQSMEVLSGFMDIRVENTLPVDISVLDFLLKNDPLYGGTTIATGSFPVIPSGTSATLSFDLSGQTLYGKMVGKILTMNTDASIGKKVVDTNDAVTTIVKIRNLKPKTAQAFFPDQDVFNVVEDISIFTVDNMMLNTIKMKAGNVQVKVNSSIRDTIYFKYFIPNATLNGVPFLVDTFITPAPPNTLVSSVFTFPFAGYEMKLHGYGVEDDPGVTQDLNKNSIYPDADTVNTFIQQIIGSIKSKNQMVTLTLGDTFYVDAGLKDVVISGATGYLGNPVVKVGSTSSKLDAFKNYVSGSLDLEDVKVDLEIDNGLGAGMTVDVLNISSKNTKFNNNTVLSSALISSPVDVPSALDVPNGNSPVTLSTVALGFNKGNSNIDQLISIFPDSLGYGLNVSLNKNIPIPTYQQVMASSPNFIYEGTSLDVNMNFEIPLAMATADLTLSSSSDFNLAKSNVNEAFTEGTFSLVCDNGFPFTADISIYLLDQSGNKIDSLFKNGSVAAANMMQSNGEWKVSSKTHSIITFDVSPAKMEHLFNSSKIMIVSKFNTAKNPDYVKVYSDYSIDCKLTGDFDFKVKLKK